MPLHRLIYMSRPVDIDMSDVDRILAVSRYNNNRDALGGILLFTSDWFVQVLEGSCLTLSTAFLRIGNDPRHTDLHLRSYEPVACRAFGAWGMSYVTQGAKTLDNFTRFFPRRYFEPDRMSAQALMELCLAVHEEGASPVHAA